MKTGKYLIIDVETGGIDPVNTSLLTGYMEVLDEDLGILGSYEFAMKHDVYKVTPGALDINKINLVEHHKVAKTTSVIATELLRFLEQYEGLIPMGHNVNFDVSFIKSQLPVDFSRFLSYKVMDTQIVARYLQMVGLVDKNNRCSLRELAKEFGIKDEQAHVAYGDVEVTKKVMVKLIELGLCLRGAK